MKDKVEGRILINTIYIIVIVAILFSNFFYKGLSVLLLLSPDYQFNNTTEIHFIDVGQGDAIAIKFDNGEVMLIDSGNEDSYQKLSYYLKNIITGKDNTINYLVLTHIDTDHSANILNIMKDFNVEVFFRPPNLSLYENNQSKSAKVAFDKIIDYAHSQKIEERMNIKDMSLKVGETMLTWLAPDIEYQFKLTNDCSPVIKLEYNGFSALLTGDASTDIEKEIIKSNYFNLDVDILKFAHHGSHNSTSAEFLTATTPEYACVSVGNNTYGHPSNLLLNRILEYDEKTNSNLFNNFYSTQDDGNVIFTLGDEIKVSTIDNIDDYSFVSYFVYSALAISILILFMLKPYYVVFRKNIRFVIQNKKFENDKDI